MNDPYMTMQREAAVAFDNVTRETPGLPDWTGPERASLLRHAGFIAELAARLKTAARNARENGNEMLAVWLIRFQLSVEETGELAEAVAEGDLPHALNELTDLAYVTDGHYLTLGAADLKLRAYEEVHSANMSKCGPDGKGVVDAAGRHVKGPGYRKPDLSRVLVEGS